LRRKRKNDIIRYGLFLKVEKRIQIMSGHSKFANIKHKKEKNDAAKGKIFTMIGRELAVAVKEGGPDPVNVLSLVMAVALNSNIRGKSALRGVYFVPNILGGLVIGYIFSFIFTYILPAVGNTFNIGFLQNSILASEKYAWIGVLIVGVWQAVAMNTIIYISGLQTVPEDVYEASMLDGAGKWKQFWKVTFPLVMPFVTINLVLSTKNFLMVFDQIMSLTKGGPAQSTESISYLIYRNGMDGGQFGFQSANAVIFFVVIVAISLFQMGVMNKKEEQL
jgi:raffinose/stachyose/melibiose transport system permease protein